MNLNRRRRWSEIRRAPSGFAVALVLLLPLTRCDVHTASYRFGDDEALAPGPAAPVFIAPGDACSENGLRVCAGAAQKQRLVCIDGVFQPELACADGENCDQLSGECSSIAAPCDGKSAGFRFCDAAGGVRLCGVDLVRVESEECSGTCQEGRCLSLGCGDGVVTAPEQCDDGNAIDTDACSNACDFTGCGDAVQQAGEECDDGNATDTDACVNCRLARCGDGIRAAGEECDDGNAVELDGCSSFCRLPTCGDQLLQSGEECDDGNTVDNDGCTNVCSLPSCGDRIVQAGEACDDGNRSDVDGCNNSCTVPGCGDGSVQSPNEECDDRNFDSTDACTAACKKPKCGDSFSQAGEECDDGNTANEDGCTNQCTVAECGDGYRQAPAEECDDGNTADTDSCTNRCKSARCGDTVIQLGEECDDANLDNNDACTTLCKPPACGDSILSAGEACEDGNRGDGDGCSASCQPERCGDAKISGVEQCDDGNKNDNDGCSAQCRNEVCGDGIVQRPREDCEDLNTNDMDLCRNGCKNAASLNALSSSCSTTGQLTQTVCMVAVANWCKQYDHTPLAGMVMGQKADNEYRVACIGGLSRHDVPESMLMGQCVPGRQQSPSCLELADTACRGMGYTQGFFLSADEDDDTIALACATSTRRDTQSVPNCNGIADTSPVPVACMQALSGKCGQGQTGMIAARASASQVTYACYDLTLTGTARLR